MYAAPRSADANFGFLHVLGISKGAWLDQRVDVGAWLVPRGDFFAWLYTIAVNVCRDLDRRRRRWRIFHPIERASEIAGDSRTDGELLRRDDAALLMRAIDTLPRKQRFAIILRDIEELPTEEVARILDSSPATVRVQISKARAKIRTLMEAPR